MTKDSIRVLWFFFTACVLANGIAAQEGNGNREIHEAKIYYVHGIEFALVRDGKQETYGPGVLNSAKASLWSGDIIRTGPDSFAELQLVPDGTGIKIAENTSVQLTWQNDGLPVINLSYGRIRIITGFQARKPALYIKTGNVSAGVRDGDFCFDYMVSGTNSREDPVAIIKPKLQIYSFRGFSEAAFTAAGTEGVAVIFPNDWPSVPVNEKESVSLEVNASLAVIDRSKPMDMGITGYWTQYNFRGSPPLPLPDTALPIETSPESAALSAAAQKYEFTASQRRLTRIKNALVVSGFTLTAVGVMTQSLGYAFMNPDDPSGARSQAAFGFIPIGIGISALISSLFFNPAFP
jgi:hypothetical protein